MNSNRPLYFQCFFLLSIYFCFAILDDWHCVATCFFIDTAHNVIEYVERIWKILKPGGAWINFGLYDDIATNDMKNTLVINLFYQGPLLYHFEDIPNEYSFELSYEDLRSIIQSCGFQIEVSDLNSTRSDYLVE